MTATETACVRRPNSTWTSCHCPPCTTTRRRLNKMLSVGLKPARVPADAAWASLDRMLALGWSATAVASATGLTPDGANSLITDRRRGHNRRLGPGVAFRLANPSRPTVGLIGATGTRRRLQALAAIGYTIEHLCSQHGFARETLRTLRRGSKREVSAVTAAAVEAAYAVLSMVPGPSSVSRDRAVARGWVPPLAWDDDAIDDPAASPQGVREVLPPGARRNRTGGQLAEDAEFLADQGETLDTAAARLDTSPVSLERSLYRAGRGDLVARLKRSDQAARSA